MQVRDNGVLNQVNKDLGGKKWSDWTYLKVQPIEFVDGLDMGYEGKRGVKKMTKDFGLSYQKNGDAIQRGAEG